MISKFKLHEILCFQSNMFKNIKVVTCRLQNVKNGDVHFLRGMDGF